ncbi:MAG: InlB B-repeat-containing protein [Clostridia bacterium]|nr:InlB B-repeat-containing protein [Clostridia bacterium]
MAVNIAIAALLAVSVVGIISACNSCDRYLIIDFDSRGGNAVERITVSVMCEDIALPIPSRQGYKFIGWFVNYLGEEIRLEKNSISKISNVGSCNAYAKWVAR